MKKFFVVVAEELVIEAKDEQEAVGKAYKLLRENYANDLNIQPREIREAPDNA